MLFNLILLTGHVPCEFGHSYTVPLLKSHDPRVKSLTTEFLEASPLAPLSLRFLSIVCKIALINFFVLVQISTGLRKA